MSILHKLPGGSQLEKWFGYVPNFHDAEVESIDLRRSPELSTLRVHTWHTSDDVDENGYFRRERHATVSFTFSVIGQLEISGWNHQNVLAGLEVTEGAEGYVITLDGTFGVDGQIVAKKLSIAVEARPQSR
jgi:hypothetical protein